MYAFIESPLFTRLVQEYLSDEEYGRLPEFLIENPESGAVIRGSGGIRKLRWAELGRGKRGGYRVIYYLRRSNETIWMLTMYPKNVADSIPAAVLRKIEEEIDYD